MGGDRVRIRQGVFMAAVMTVALIMALLGMMPRIRAEGSGNVAALVTDIRDISAMARETGIPVEEALEQLLSKGLTGVAVGELTGEELRAGFLAVDFGSVENLVPGAIPDGVQPDSAALLLHGDAPYFREITGFISVKFPGSRSFPLGSDSLVVLPLSLVETLEAGILPDLPLIEMLKGTDIPLIYRPGSTPGVPGENVALALELVLDSVPGIRAVVPAGIFVAGYPELAPLSNLLRERGLSVSKVEFSQQIGTGFLERNLFPDILPLHSVRNEEIISRRISREDLVERFVRASRERSVKILYLRPSVLHSGSRLERFGEEIRRISGRLGVLGISTGWPQTLPLWRTSILSALAAALVLVFLSARVILRFSGKEDEPAGIRLISAVMVLSLLLAVCMLRVSLAARAAGAILATLAAVESSLLALNSFRRPFRGVLYGITVAVISGMAIASFFGTPWYMLRMGAFSGVKIALLLPPAILLLHDLRRRVHPESLQQVLSRPPLWGELVLIGGLVAAAGLMVLRSGNVSFVPGWEIRFRELLEQILVARPRTKEIFAGYPALVLCFAVRRMDIWKGTREVFRLGTTLAFSSVVNSFCHFHTHLQFILLRVFNGLWTGLLVGSIMAAVLIFLIVPLWKRWQGVVAG